MVCYERVRRNATPVVGVYKQGICNLSFELGTLIILAKYAVGGGALVCVACAPCWLAEKNKKSALVVLQVRAAAWLFGWTGVGYMIALYLAAKK